MSLETKLADHVAGLPRSGIRDFFELVQARGDVISLGVGEPDFPAPWHIREAAIYSLEKGETSYSSNLGIASLREEISNHVGKSHGIEYDPATEVIVTVGVSEGLDLAVRALCDPGDEIIYHEPCYVSYSPSILLAHGVPVVVPTVAENDFALMAADVEAAITPRTKAILLNYPTNPTGAVEPPEEMEKIAKLAVEHDLIVLTDEIYSELVYDDVDHVSILSFPGMRERTLLLHGFSKAYAMTGFRLGYACGPPLLIEAMMKIHQYSMLCAPMTSQVAAVEALRNGDEPARMMHRAYAQRRRMVLSRFEKMGLPCFTPRGAFYAFPETACTGLSSKDFALKLLEEENVAVVPGTAFGPSGEGHVRCCYATDPDLLATALDRIAGFAERHRK